MCGADSTSATIEVEGVRMWVCKGCSSVGRTVERDQPVDQRRSFAPKFVEQERFEKPKRKELVEEVHPDIAKILIEHRKGTGMTQEQFAGKLNIKTSVYQHFESGARHPSIETARKLERELKKHLVVRIDVGDVRLKKEETQGMTLGDIFKAKRQ